jgi:uncharacterized SAM-binding protein YcdF (DUF218 family)
MDFIRQYIIFFHCLVIFLTWNVGMMEYWVENKLEFNMI